MQPIDDRGDVGIVGQSHPISPGDFCSHVKIGVAEIQTLGPSPADGKFNGRRRRQRRQGMKFHKFCRVKSAGSRGEHVSCVAGPAHSCISLVPVVVKTSHFTATRWAQKILPYNPLHHWSNKSQESRRTSVI